MFGSFVDLNQTAIKDQLFALLEVDNCTADGLTNAILALLEKFHISHDNIIGLGADNASVMMGQLGGVQAKLKEKVNPNIFVIGCICHSLHLCASVASKKNHPQWRNLFKTFTTTYREVQKGSQVMQNSKNL